MVVALVFVTIIIAAITLNNIFVMFIFSPFFLYFLFVFFCFVCLVLSSFVICLRQGYGETSCEPAKQSRNPLVRVSSWAGLTSSPPLEEYAIAGGG
jgi:hypothetical protein